MRSVLVSLLVTSAALLAGCSDGGGHEHESYTCPDGTELHLDELPGHDNATFNPLSHCTGGSGTGTNTTGSRPNVLPTIVLTTTDDGGNVTTFTNLMGNLTFSAEGSTDSDGSITGIAVSVTDSNTTRTASLYDATAKSFRTATFKFDRPGVVNVTVAMVDDRAGFTVNQSKVYVNHPQELQPQTIQMPGGGEFDACTGSTGVLLTGSGDEIVSANYFKPFKFTVVPGATLIEATATATPPSAGPASAPAGTVTIIICAPDGAGGFTPVSASANGATVTNTPELPAPAGTDSYQVGATLTQTSAPSQLVSVSVLVHYEPQTAAPAAE